MFSLEIGVKTAFNLAGIKGRLKTVHSLRHSAITNAIVNGASVTEAQSMARHKSPSTTMVYFHDLTRFENAAERRVKYRKKE
jgi:integrase/recombinase XerC